MNNAVKTTSHNHTAVIHPEPTGGYWAEVPELNGCYTQGESLDEVYDNLREAVACHLDVELNQVRIDVLEMAA